MDVGVYVTSLRALKNLLLVGDAVKSIMFVAFQVCFYSFLSAISHDQDVYCLQEDPYKLLLISKDLRQIPTASVDFFFTNEELGIVSADDEGILRVYEYNPQGKSATRPIRLFWSLTDKCYGRS